MIKSHKTLLGFIGIFALGVLLAGGFAVYSFGSSLAAQAPQSSTPTPGANQQIVGGGVFGQYENQFFENLARRLNVTVEQLRQAIAGAGSDTIDQALKDGKISQSQADQEKQEFNNWAQSGQGPVPFFFGGKGHGHGFGGGFGGRGFEGQILASVAKALNIDQQTLITDLRNGQSIADIAAAQKVDLNTLKQTLLSDLKTQLSTLVTNNQLTQAQSDQIYQNFSNNIDTYLNQKWNTGEWFHGPKGPGFFGPANPNNNNNNNGTGTGG